MRFVYVLQEILLPLMETSFKYRMLSVGYTRTLFLTNWNIIPQ